MKEHSCSSIRSFSLAISFNFFSFARSLPRKSINEHCKGDVAKKEKKLQQKQNEIIERELQEATFQPKINRSNLAVSCVNNSFLFERKQQAKEKKLKEIAKENERIELQECSFKPSIRDSPSYIKKLSRSFSTTTKERNHPIETKPQWK